MKKHIEVRKYILASALLLVTTAGCLPPTARRWKRKKHIPNPTTLMAMRK